MGFCEVLTIIFVLLKVFGVVSWSWWIVLLPEIIAVVIYVLFFVLHLCGVRSMSRKIDKEFKDFRF